MIIKHIPAKQALDDSFKAGYKAGNQEGVELFWHRLVPSLQGGRIPMTIEEAVEFLKKEWQEIQSRQSALNQREAALLTKTEVCDPVLLAELKMKISEQKAKIIDLEARLSASEGAAEDADLSWRYFRYEKNCEIDKLTRKIETLNDLLKWEDENK
jgi:hypothetical protein